MISAFTTSAFLLTRSLPSQPFLSVKVDPLVEGGASAVADESGVGLVAMFRQGWEVGELIGATVCAFNEDRGITVVILCDCARLHSDLWSQSRQGGAEGVLLADFACEWKTNCFPLFRDEMLSTIPFFFERKCN